jgi:transposase-like protein
MSAKWTEMSGEERYRVVELARSGTVSMSELCESFAVTRQTLSRAMEKAAAAARSALEPGKPGRKGKSEEEERITELSKKQSSLEREVEQWKTRYAVMKKFAELAREKVEGDEEGKVVRLDQKKRRRPTKSSSGKLLARRDGAPVAGDGDGGGAGDRDGEPAAVGEAEGDAEE